MNGNCLYPFTLPSANTFLDAGEIALFGSISQSSPDGIQIYIYHACNNSGFVEENLAFEP